MSPRTATRSFTVAVVFARVRWRLLRGSMRMGGTDRVGAILSTIASTIVGLGAGLAVLLAGRTVDDPAQLGVVFCSAVTFGVLGLGIVAGVSQPIDPRVIAAEPLADGERNVGLLAASACGPPGLAGAAIGIGFGVGMIDRPSSVPIVALATIAFLIGLLLVARTATNVLALVTHRFPRLGQLVVGVTGLAVYGLFQFIPAVIGGIGDERRGRLLDAIAWTPPGQLGVAAADAGDDPWGAAVHLVGGAWWLPVLFVGFVATTNRLTSAVSQPGRLDAAEAGPMRRLLRRAAGSGPQGAIAWRSLLTRFRTPRAALETFTGAGVGLGAVLVPTLWRGEVGSGAVLVGGAVQLAVLFMAGNSFGIDGPAVSSEIVAGADPGTMVRGKARSIVMVAAPLALLGPLIVAGVSGEWTYLAAGFCVGVGSLLAGSGAAVVQSALVPIAVPESDNPFAGGETGQGMISAILLGLVLLCLTIATVPIALALIWALDRGSIALISVASLLTIAVGALVLRVGIGLATRRLTGRDPEFIASVTPAR